jgi:hypothetical protein
MKLLLFDPICLDELGVDLKPVREMGMTTIKVLDAPRAVVELEAATKGVQRCGSGLAAAREIS